MECSSSCLEESASSSKTKQASAKTSPVGRAAWKGSSQSREAYREAFLIQQRYTPADLCIRTAAISFGPKPRSRPELRQVELSAAKRSRENSSGLVSLPA